MNGSITLQQSFDLTTCPSCGIAYAVPAWFLDSRRKDTRLFYCPNGHSASFTKSTAEILKEKLAEKDRVLQQALNREAALSGQLKKTELAKKRLAKRLESGVCPVVGCKRHFTNLQRHIQTEHAGVAIPAADNGQKLLEAKA